MHGGLRLRRLDRLANRLVHDGLAPTTRRLYASGARLYRRFCRSHNLQASPATETTLLRFIAHLARRNTSASRIGSHLSGVRQWHIQRGAPWIGRTERVKLALRGAAKVQRPTRRPRLAATLKHLRLLRSALRRSSMPPRDRAAAWAAVLLGFFGALRGSEYLSPYPHRFHARRTCQWRHLSLHRNSLGLTLPASKTDQLYAGSLVSLPALPGHICPVRALRRYRRLATDHSPTRPIFTRDDGGLCTPAWLNRVLRDADLDPAGRLTTHSLRIGFATAAAAAGVAEDVIQVSGRWRGSSYLRYIRGPRLAVWQACRSLL